MSAMTTSYRAPGFRGRRLTLSLAAASVLAVTLPWGAAASAADDPEPTDPPASTAAFSGFSSSAKASPLRVDIYEPTIPIPAEPQAEVSLMYSLASADTSGSKARASYAWPGAPVGEGFKTILENLGLPEQIVAPLAETGYPVQVNAIFPGNDTEEVDEPVPGSIQRASAGDKEAFASAGFSTDGKANDDVEGEGPSGVLPGLDLPGLGGLLGGLLGVENSQEPPTNSLLPEPLSALIDVGGVTSVSRTDNGDRAFAQARANVGDINLLGGLVSLEGVKVLAKATSDGTKGVGDGEVTFGSLTALGQKFRFGPDGFEAVGTGIPVPGFPKDAGKALAMLGLKISAAEPVVQRDGDAVTVTTEGLVLDFDLTVLKTQLRPLLDVVDTLLGLLPEQAAPLTDNLRLLTLLSPRVVLTLGSATAAVDTSQGIDPPTVDPTEPIEEPTEETAPPASSGGGSISTGGGDGTVSSPPVTDSPVATTDGVSNEPTELSAAETPGLPELFSIPTLLILGGLALASLMGTYARRLGLLALGGVGSCPHGLDSGLPDLRKVT